MQTGLRMQYGYSTQYNEENEKLTSAWDIMQTRVSIEAPCFQLNRFKVKVELLSYLKGSFVHIFHLAQLLYACQMLFIFSNDVI